jgi:carboxylate-amine ligase
MDIQECPSADLAITTLVIETIRALVEERFISYDAQMRWKTEKLVALLDQTTNQAENASLNDQDYLAIFGLAKQEATASELWRHIFNHLSKPTDALPRWKPELDVILQQGSLATRIKRALPTNPTMQEIIQVYQQLCGCLDQNKMFLL